MAWEQKTVHLKAQPRGFHLVTDEVLKQLPELQQYRVGLVHLFIQHTSASITLNENADPDVRGDMERHFNQMVPENQPYYEHTLEGPDDMPAHIKAVLTGPSISVPIADGRLQVGVWQGIYLGEHRDSAGGRKIVATIQGET